MVQLLTLALRYTAFIGLVHAASIIKSPYSTESSDSKPLPLVIWHGLGDNFENEGLQSVGKVAEEVNPGTTVYFVRLGDDGGADRTATFWGNLTEQLESVCNAIAEHEVLGQAPAINAMGFSQGGQFLRGYVERCNSPPVANLVTFGSQHNGISEFQECAGGDWLCKGAEGLLRGNTWTGWVQSHLVPAQYFRDPEDLESYLEYSNFLADINNERPLKNQKYVANMKKLEKLVMYVFAEDQAVHPKESGWFSEVNSTSGEVTKLQDRKIYEEDWLGLRWLDERGRLDFKETEGKHMQISDEVLKHVFKTYFAPKDNTAEDMDSPTLEL